MVELHERLQQLLKNMPEMSTRKYVDESCSLLADYLVRVEVLERDLKLQKELLSAEQEETRQLRFHKNANWELAVKMENLAAGLANAALVSLSGVVCTPEEGYMKAPHCLVGDIRKLRDLEAAATQRAESAEKGWKKALETIEFLKRGIRDCRLVTRPV